MSDVNWTQPRPGDPGTPRDVNRDEDVVWDGTDPKRRANQSSEGDQATKKAAPKKVTS